MSETVCRWGFLSTAEIGRKNWDAIHNSGNGRIVAVASRDEEKAQRYVASCQADAVFDPAPRATGSYDDLLASDDIDAVYVPLPTGVRKEWVIKAANAGKHVMCEKPCATSLADLEEMTAACAANNVQFMDGVMFMHSSRMAKMQEALNDGTSVGELRRIVANFTFNAPDEFFQGNIRAHSSLEPQGCVGDLGWYTIRISLFAKNYEMPKTVTGRLLSSIGRPDSPDEVPTQFSGELVWEDGVTASLFNSFRTENHQLFSVSGSKGWLKAEDYVLPFAGSDELEFQVTNSEFTAENLRFEMDRNMRRVTVNEHPNNHPSAQETNLFRNFSSLVLKGEVDPFWPEVSLKTQRVMDACLLSARNGGQPVDPSEL